MQQTTIKTFGNVTKDAQTRTGKNNRTFTVFTVATNPQEGTTQFLKCFAWGSQKRFAEKLSKGQRVQVTGTMTERQANNGETVFLVKTEFVRSIIRKKQAA
jgi:single-stranded DNA-binding protein